MSKFYAVWWYLNSIVDDIALHRGCSVSAPICLLSIHLNILIYMCYTRDNFWEFGETFKRIPSYCIMFFWFSYWLVVSAYFQNTTTVMIIFNTGSSPLLYDSNKCRECIHSCIFIDIFHYYEAMYRFLNLFHFRILLVLTTDPGCSGDALPPV